VEVKPQPRGCGPPRNLEHETASLDQLHRRYARAVFNYVLRRVPNPTDAEDITAEVFIAVAAQSARYDGRAGPYSWLIGIARRKIADVVRHQQRQPERLETDLTDVEREYLELLLATETEHLPVQALESKETVRVMNQLLSRLPDVQREVLLLQVADGLSIKEIAIVIGRSEKATNSLLQRARASIFRNGRSYFRT
jgi:RNA polymerase sigma-70 factor (ECF subfamily)